MSLEMQDLDMEVDEYAHNKVYEPVTDSLVPVIDISPLIDLTSSPH
jgi:hypothetical protein